MKTIHNCVLAFLACLSFQSCLHDDTKIFEDSAAQRLEATAENGKAVLEDASNGWLLHYCTGENYSGGVYTILLKFKDGKVTVAGDVALAEPAERAISSYTINNSQGPVLDFNTYNSILHQLGTPTVSDINGQEADYEFVITEIATDSISLKGKKFGNRMSLVRMPDSVDWTCFLDSIANVSKKLGFNYNLEVGSKEELKADLFCDNRLISVKDANGNVSEQPFYVTTKGIQLTSPILGVYQEVTELLVDEDGQLSTADGGLTLRPYIPARDVWIGKWTVESSGNMAELEISKTSNKRLMRGKLTVKEVSYEKDGETLTQDVTYKVDLTYDPETGFLNLEQQKVYDPTGIYPFVWLLNADMSQGALLGYGGINIKWVASKQTAVVEDDGLMAAQGYNLHTDTFFGYACDASGELLTQDGYYVSLFYLYKLQGLTKE